MKAWLFQDSKQKAKLGEKCPWSVGWFDPNTGKKRSKKVGCRSMAAKYARKVEGQAAAGLLVGETKKTWESFIIEYRKDKVPG